jgi:hypothetical protein
MKLAVPSATARAARSSAGSRTRTIVAAGASIPSSSTAKMVFPLVTAKSSSWPFVLLSSSSASWCSSMITSPASPGAALTPSARTSK